MPHFCFFFSLFRRNSANALINGQILAALFGYVRQEKVDGHRWCLKRGTLKNGKYISKTFKWEIYLPIIFYSGGGEKGDATAVVCDV